MKSEICDYTIIDVLSQIMALDNVVIHFYNTF